MQLNRARAPVLRQACFATAALGAGLAVTAVAQVSPVPVSVSSNVQVNARAASQRVEDYKSPSLAVNPNDPANLVAVFRNDSPDYGCHIHHSVDGGKSWAASPFPAPPRGTCWSPSVAFDSSNNVYVAAQNRPPRGGSQDIIVWKSTDGGRSFAFPGKNPAGQPGGPGYPGFQAGITVDTHPRSPHQGRIYLTWYNFPNFPASIQVYVAYSDDGGATFSTPTTAPVNGEFQVFPNPVVAPDGSLYIVYKDTAACPAGQGIPGAAASSPSRCPIRVLRSSDGGQTLGGRFEVHPATYKDLSAGEQPGMVVTPSGELLVTFVSLPPVGSPCPQELDAFVARSADRGQTWSAPVRVNNDPCTNGASQRDPRISVAPDGRVDAIFYDNRGNPGGMRYEVFYAYSTDGGRTFGQNIRVSDRSFDATRLFTPRASGFQSNEFDQQNGIASTDAGAVGAWGDARNDPANSTDVFSARSELGTAQQPGGPTPTAGGARCAGANNTITASSADNKITGTLAADEIFAGGGDDVVDSLAGSDCVDLGTGNDRGQAGSGHDRVAGGRGNDRASGSAGRDRLIGGAGRDRLSGGAGRDRVLGGIGADRIFGGFGNDRLHGLAGSDRVVASRGRDRVNGGRGRDRLSGGSSPDVLNGDAGNDRLDGGSAADILRGNSGNDRIIARTGRDRIGGGAGRDRISGGAGRDRISGGAGRDRIFARDGRSDRVACGRGPDTVIADRSDRVARSCERVRRR